MKRISMLLAALLLLSAATTGFAYAEEDSREYKNAQSARRKAERLISERYYVDAYPILEEISDVIDVSDLLDHFTVVKDVLLEWRVDESDNFGNSANGYREVYRYYPDGKLHSVTGGSGTENFSSIKSLPLPFSSTLNHIWDYNSTHVSSVCTEIYDYDDEGRLIKITGCEDSSLLYYRQGPFDAGLVYYVDITYDEAGLPVNEHVLTASDEGDMVLTYQNGLLYQGKLTRNQYPSFTLYYDDHGNVIRAETPDGFTNYEFSYEYNDDGTIASKWFSYPYMESFTHYYHYDENGRLIDYERVYDEPSHLKARGYYIYGDDILYTE